MTEESEDELSLRPLDILDEIFQQGEISKERLNYFKKKFKQLNNLYDKTQSNEIAKRKEMQERNKELSKKQQEAEDEERKNSIHHDELIQLREEQERVEAKLGEKQEEEGKLELEKVEHERIKENLEEELEKKKQEASEKIKPHIENLKGNIQDLKNEVADMEKRRVKLQDELDSAQKSSDQYRKEIERLQTENEECDKEINEIGKSPERSRKQGDNLQKVYDLTREELSENEEKEKKMDNQLKDQKEKIKQMKELRNKLYKATETYELATHNLEQQKDEIRSNIEKESERYNNALADSVEINIQLDSIKKERDFENKKLKRLQQENQTFGQQHKNQDKALNNIREQSKRLKQQLDQANYEYSQIVKEKEQNDKRLAELEKEMDITMNNYLKKEGNQKSLGDKYSQIQEESNLLEEELQNAINEDRELARKTKALGLSKDETAREASQAFRKYQEAENQVIVNMGLIVDLRKRYKEMQKRLKQQNELYQTMKQDKTKYLTLNQDSAQALAEIKEKNRILENEIEVLKNDSHVCETRLNKINRKKTKNYEKIEKLRSDLNQKRIQANRKEDEIKEQTLEINKLNSMIDKTEEEMLRTKQEYERIVEDRNQTGISLIDRNDELCILYEKSTMQESIIQEGDVEMGQREQEIRMLNIEFNDVNREISVAKKMIPKLQELAEENERLANEYEQEKKKVAELSKSLEDPENTKRWRDVSGREIDHEELKKKIQKLEEQLNAREEQVMEKNIILEDHETETEKTKQKVDHDHEDNVKLARKKNESQFRINKQTKEMKALLSELSIHQAKADELSQTRENKESELESALNRVKEGLAPTADADEEFDRMQEQEERENEYIRERKRKLEEERNMPATVVRTTAEKRPNAYIPDDGLGLPQPYLMKPFKPTQPGSSMRHIRKPEPKEVEL